MVVLSLRFNWNEYMHLIAGLMVCFGSVLLALNMGDVVGMDVGRVSLVRPFRIGLPSPLFTGMRSI